MFSYILFVLNINNKETVDKNPSEMSYVNNNCGRDQTTVLGKLKRNTLGEHTLPGSLDQRWAHQTDTI